jgi:hypothetical protein
MRCYLELFLGPKVVTEIPEKIKSMGFVSGTRMCHENKMGANCE